jgi:Outer membrane protein beta-barrel domain
MHHKLISCIFFSFFVISASGQIKYGLTGGINRSTMVIPDFTNYYITGFDVGVTTEIGMSDHFYLSPQLVYITRGSATFGTNKIRLQYLSLPLLTGYKVNHHWEILAGPNVGYLLSAIEYPLNLKNYCSSFDFGLNGTLRYRINSRSGIDLSYLFSLNGVYKSEHTVDMQNYTLPDAHNQSFQISFFYLIN